MYYELLYSEENDLAAHPVANAKFLLQDLEREVETLSTNATVHPSSTFWLRNFSSIASYSWFEGASPFIAVPGVSSGQILNDLAYTKVLGHPRIWSNAPSRVPADSGICFVDGNGAHMGHRSPLLPIFAAIDTLRDNFPYRDLDLVTDRNSLRKLLRCIDQQSNRAFRIDIDLVGKTCLFTRREESSMETINEFRGYGHEYEKAATKSRRGSEGEVSHHRIVTYVSRHHHDEIIMWLTSNVRIFVDYRYSFGTKSMPVRSPKARIISSPLSPH